MAELQAAHASRPSTLRPTERTRIAREIHDVVAHSLTVTMLHVTGARRADRHRSRCRAAEALERAETGRPARAWTRSGRWWVSCGPTTGAGRQRRRRSPALDDIPALVEQYREAGLRGVGRLSTSTASSPTPPPRSPHSESCRRRSSNVLQHSSGGTRRAPSRWRHRAERVLRIVAENPTTVTASARPHVTDWVCVAWRNACVPRAAPSRRGGPRPRPGGSTRRCRCVARCATS